MFQTEQLNTGSLSELKRSEFVPEGHLGSPGANTLWVHASHIYICVDQGLRPTVAPAAKPAAQQRCFCVRRCLLSIRPLRTGLPTITAWIKVPPTQGYTAPPSSYSQKTDRAIPRWFV